MVKIFEFCPRLYFWVSLFQSFDDGVEDVSSIVHLIIYFHFDLKTPHNHDQVCSEKLIFNIFLKSNQSSSEMVSSGSDSVAISEISDVSNRRSGILRQSSPISVKDIQFCSF